MIKFEIKDKETGKTATYVKEDITMGEAEKFYDHMEFSEKENAKEKPDARKVRKNERQFLANLFKDQGLTEEDILNNMSTKTYSRVFDALFQEMQGEDGESSEDASEEVGKTEEQSQ